MRLDEIPEGNVRPRIILGFCKEDFVVEKELIRQDKVWALSLQSGDKFTAKHWSPYYAIEGPVSARKEPEFGLFVTGTIIGVLLDMDRGFIRFYKDGNDLGEAFASDELAEGGLHPIIQTKVECRFSVFHPSVWPWVLNVPVEPTPPQEPSRPEDYFTVIEEEEPQDATAILS